MALSVTNIISLTKVKTSFWLKYMAAVVKFPNPQTPTFQQQRIWRIFVVGAVGTHVARMTNDIDRHVYFISHMRPVMFLIHRDIHLIKSNRDW